MPTRQIEKESWSRFLEGFSAHNQMREIAVDVEDNELGSQTLVDRKPFLAMETDLRDNIEPSIVLVAGDPAGGDPSVLRHRVMDPNSLWVKEDDTGRAEALDIEADNGKTVIRFV